MLSKVKQFGHIVACGAISGYNDAEKGKVTGWADITRNRLTIRGFVIIDFIKDFAEGINAIVSAIKEGKINITEDVSVIDLSKEIDVLSKVPETWGLLFSNKKINGKLVTKIA
ncbi:unnamed protein product [Debaryomyces tyrocola]|nr:unnamed protein product [Debaryomyces tyrocola]